VVVDPLGKLYNKDAIIEFFLDKSKYGDGDRICGHLKGVKVSRLGRATRSRTDRQDLLTLNLTDNPLYTAPSAATTAQTPQHAPFACPLSLKEMSGAVPFIALKPCGCVFSDASIRAVIPNLTKGIAAKAVKSDEKPDEAKPVAEAGKLVACPNCTKEFDPTLPTSIQPINPTREVQEILLDHLLAARASAKSNKKRKAAVDPVVETKAARVASASPRPASSPAPSSNGRGTPPVPTANSLHRSVHQQLADQEKKRLAAQAGMSDAVKAMFKPKAKEDDRKGNADFFGRTFTRVSLHHKAWRMLLLTAVCVACAIYAAELWVRDDSRYSMASLCKVGYRALYVKIRSCIHH